MEKEISLLEALTGIDFTIMHLDGRIIKITNDKGQIIKPGQKMTVEGLGMPFHKTSYKFGNLFITFKIKFPDTMTSAEASTVASVLKTSKLPSEQQDIEACKETVSCREFSEADKNTQATGGKTRQPASDEEMDDEEGGQGQPGC
jgi:DnaJ-class molecular chaperone